MKHVQIEIVCMESFVKYSSFEGESKEGFLTKLRMYRNCAENVENIVKKL